MHTHGRTNFATKFAAFKKPVGEHAQTDEHQEFPLLKRGQTGAQRLQLGQDFLAELANAST